MMVGRRNRIFREISESQLAFQTASLHGRRAGGKSLKTPFHKCRVLEKRRDPSMKGMRAQA